LGIIFVSESVHAEIMFLCGSNAKPVFAKGAAYLEFYFGGMDILSFFGGLTLMLVAMMTPALSGPFLHLWFRSLSRHRWRAIVLFLFSYIMVWLVASTLLFIVALFLFSVTGSAIIAGVIALVGGGIWQVSAMRERCLGHCHLRPRLSIFGVAALVDPLRFGAVHSLWCVTTCWGLMLVSLSMPAAHFQIMVFGTFLVAHERTSQKGVYDPRVLGFVYGMFDVFSRSVLEVRRLIGKR
jgi:predicted metal-binding membrane protein